MDKTKKIAMKKDNSKVGGYILLFLTVVFLTATLSCEKQEYNIVPWEFTNVYEDELVYEVTSTTKALIDCEYDYPIGSNSKIWEKDNNAECNPDVPYSRCTEIGGKELRSDVFFYVWLIRSPSYDLCTYFIGHDPYNPDLKIANSFLQFYSPEITRLKVRPRGTRTYIYGKSNKLSY